MRIYWFNRELVLAPKTILILIDFKITRVANGRSDQVFDSVEFEREMFFQIAGRVTDPNKKCYPQIKSCDLAI